VNGVPETYVPAAWFAATFSVAPTLSVAVPPVNVPVEGGLLVNALTVMLFPPDDTVRGEPGSEIEKVYAEAPVIVNEAAATVPVVAGRVTPPVNVRVPAGARMTVPAVAFTATLPKFISTVFEIVIGVTMVADVVAVAETCAKDFPAYPNIRRIKIVAIFFMVFIYTGIRSRVMCFKQSLLLNFN
jgi:hypothetical protein